MKKLFCIMVVLMLTCSLAFAENIKRTATVMDVQGAAYTKTTGSENWVELKKGAILNQGDALSTKANSTVILKLEGALETATVEIKPNSQMTIAELVEDKSKATQSTLLDLAIGEILIKAEKLRSEKSKFEVKTPTSVVAVRGTSFAVAVEAVE